jgi:signal transduction histidine kinase
MSGRIFYETQYAPLLQLQGFVKEVALDLVCRGRDLLPVLTNSAQQDGNGDRPTLIRTTFFDATERRRYEQDLLRARQALEEEVKNRTAELEREVVERKRAEEDLRELTSKLLKLRDEERRRLARELHDSVGQMLAALNMNAAMIEEEASKLSPRAAAALAENSSLVRQINAEIRTISHLLHPPMLDEVGLTSALRWYIDGLAERASMKIGLELSPALARLPEDLELAIFRIVQECLTNVHRHSGSKTAVVRVLYSTEGIRVEVQDQGAGIAAGRLKELRSFGSGVGLRGMKERARQLGGNLEITSGVQGTLIATTFPTSKES